MELAEVVNTQYAFPVGIVLICAVFVFAFGFKSSNPPTFSQLVHAVNERKTSGKKRKLKDKKYVQNSLFSSVTNDDGRKQKSDNSSKISVGKASKQTRNAKDDAAKCPVTSSKQQLKKNNVSQKENVNESVLVGGKISIKNGKHSLEGRKIHSIKDTSVDSKVKSQEKRLLKEKNYNIQQIKTNKDTPDAKTKSSKSSKSKLNEEKPIDFDDGQWEQAISRKEKKSKRKDEEALIAANALNSGAGSLPVKQSSVSSAVPNSASMASSATADTHNLVHCNGTSSNITTADDHHHVDFNIDDPVFGSAVAGHVQLLSGENQKKGAAAKVANACVPSSTPIEKPKSSKSKGKIRESSLASQKDTTQQENENTTVGSVHLTTEEGTKSKKKKKQLNAVDNKEARIPAQSVEAPELPNIDVEVVSGTGGQGVGQDIIADTKVEPQAAVVFDELGDVWKEAKTPKKNKKKVRKDQ